MLITHIKMHNARAILFPASRQKLLKMHLIPMISMGLSIRSYYVSKKTPGTPQNMAVELVQCLDCPMSFEVSICFYSLSFTPRRTPIPKTIQSVNPPTDRKHHSSESLTSLLRRFHADSCAQEPARGEGRRRPRPGGLLRGVFSLGCRRVVAVYVFSGCEARC